MNSPSQPAASARWARSATTRGSANSPKFGMLMAKRIGSCWHLVPTAWAPGPGTPQYHNPPGPQQCSTAPRCHIDAQNGEIGRGFQGVPANVDSRKMSAFGSRLVAQYPKTPVALCDGHGIFLVAASGQILMAADMTAGSTGRRADSGPAAGARAGQEGLLAMVMTAGA